MVGLEKELYVDVEIRRERLADWQKRERVCE